MSAPPTPTTLARALEVLQRVFGYPAFRGSQADVVTHIADGGNAMVLMPTGGGKSLCYQIPALMRPGVGVVISPLIALMEDQVAALTRRGIRAALLNSTLDRDESARVEQHVRDGALDFLYLAPERLLTDRCLRMLAASPLALFAIDEAHCISEWGHDFRPEYLKLSILHERFAAVPRIALTATADAATCVEIVRLLALGDARHFGASFDRPNIRYRIVEKRDAHAQLLRFIRREHAGETGVVYCQTRGRVEETAAFLETHDIIALPYHAGLSAEDRRANQAWFLRESGVVMVATIAFGMGIDKADVRFVAHVDVSKSVEGYFQESGRGGRDGLPAEAWMAYSAADAEPIRRMARESAGSALRRRLQLAKLDAMLAICESVECRRVRLLAYFGEASRPCGRCDTCRTPAPSYDASSVIDQLLACVHRTGQRLDADRIVDLLRRDDARRNADEWRAIIRQCIAIGVLTIDYAAGDALRRGLHGSAVLRGERRVRLRAWVASRSPKTARRAPGRSAPADQRLLDALWAWRAVEAKTRGVPVHMVFHDLTLTRLAQERPSFQWTLRKLIGRAKTGLYAGHLRRLMATVPSRSC